MSGSNDLLGDLVAKAQRGARGETGALELLERETEMRNLSKKAKTIIAGAAIAGLASSGVAYAYWTTTGGGTGNASTRSGDVASMTVSGSAGQVSPGTADAAISGTVTNSGTSNGYVDTVTASVVDTSNALCDTTNFSIVGPAAVVAFDIAPTANRPFSGQSLHFINKGTPQDACKNVTVHLSFVSN